ncbi:MAG TPA: hypothetical protein VMI56_17680 [Reyranella sp.]|nr:hypothetical protein [Reyranella sp.]
MRPVVVGVTVAALALGGCIPDEGASTSAASMDQSTMSPAERDLQAKTEQQRKTDAAIAGGVGGAILGAALGYALGGWQGAALGAAGGAMTGAAVGYGYGSYMNARARQYSSQEQRAQEVTKSANSTVDYYNQVNASARTILAEQQAKVAQLNNDYKAGAITKEQYRQQLANAGANQTNLKAQISGIDKQIAEMKGDEQSAVLTSQVQQLQAQRDQLQSTYDGLVQLYGTVPSEVQQGSAIVVSSK